MGTPPFFEKSLFENPEGRRLEVFNQDPETGRIPMMAEDDGFVFEMEPSEAENYLMQRDFQPIDE